MNAEWVRLFLLGLPEAVETVQWGDNLVFWVGDKAIGGKMFALMNMDHGRLGGGGRAVISYPAGPERYGELLEIDGVIPAPYLARVYWVAIERWDVFRRSEWELELQAAHAMTLAKLPTKTRKVLALSAAEKKRLVTVRRKVLAERAAGKK